MHRLVAFAFIPNPLNKPCINHKDGNPFNNNVENLEWCTQQENVIHAVETGLKKTYKFDKNELIKLYKINGLKGVAKIYNVSATPIKRALIKYGILIKHTGRQIKYNITKELILDGLKTKSQKQLAKEIGCQQTLISIYLKRINTRGEIYE